MFGWMLGTSRKKQYRLYSLGLRAPKGALVCKRIEVVQLGDPNGLGKEAV